MVNQIITIAQQVEICQLRPEDLVMYDNEEIGFLDVLNHAIDPDESDAPNIAEHDFYNRNIETKSGTLSLGHHLMDLYDRNVPIALVLTMDNEDNVNQAVQDQTDWKNIYWFHVQDDKDTGTVFIYTMEPITDEQMDSGMFDELAR